MDGNITKEVLCVRFEAAITMRRAERHSKIIIIDAPLFFASSFTVVFVCCRRLSSSSLPLLSVCPCLGVANYSRLSPSMTSGGALAQTWPDCNDRHCIIVVNLPTYLMLPLLFSMMGGGGDGHRDAGSSDLS